MGNTVTLSRTTPGALDATWISNQAGNVEISLWDPRSSVGISKPLQVTTSYRTGRKEVPRDDSASENIPRTFSAGFQQWKREAKVAERPYDTGHEFDSNKQDFVCSHPRVSPPRDPLYGTVYHGPLLPNFGDFGLGSPTWPVPAGVNTSYYGPKAIQATVPTRSVASLGVALGELKKDGIPALVGAESMKHRTSVARNAGSEYLNVEFGWAPLESDIKNALRAVFESGKILSQYQRDSGKWVRRRHHFPSVSSVTQETSFTPVMLFQRTFPA